MLKSIIRKQINFNEKLLTIRCLRMFEVILQLYEECFNFFVNKDILQVKTLDNEF